MGNLQQFQTLIGIASTVGGILFFLLVIIVTNMMSKMREKMMDKVDTKFSEMKADVDAKFTDMKKEMHDTLITKDYFNGKFDLLNQKIDIFLPSRNKSNNDG